jgi:hypothetical protein
MKPAAPSLLFIPFPFLLPLRYSLPERRAFHSNYVNEQATEVYQPAQTGGSNDRR